MARRYVLDSCALLAYLQEESGAQLVEDLVIADDTELFMSTISLGEVLYIVQRSFGQDAAAHVEATILDTPKIQLVDAAWDRVKAAARLKAKGGISFSDCFGAALAQELDATMLTCNAEFGQLEADGRMRVARLA